jgi:hypothetical protein
MREWFRTATTEKTSSVQPGLGRYTHFSGSGRIVIHIIHRNTNDRTKIIHDLGRRCGGYGNGEFQMGFEAGEDVIDEIVASCNGDIRGALRALLMVNERLEDELQQLYAAAREGSTLH